MTGWAGQDEVRRIRFSPDAVGESEKRSSIQQIRPAQKRELPEIIALWSVCLRHDQADAKLLEQFLENAECCDPEGVLVAEADGEIVGFIIAIGNQGDTGWIPLFFVHPKHLRTGIGDSLLLGAESYLAGKGARDVRVEPFGRHARFSTGIDSRYLELIELLCQNGFRVADDSQVDIVKDLKMFEMPGWVMKARRSLEPEITFGFCEPQFRQALLEFMSAHFSAYSGWCEVVREYGKQEGDPRLRVLAFRSGGVIGFTAFEKDVDWYIWATGVRKDLRGRMIGSILVHMALEEMKRRGADRMCISDCPIEFYKVVEGEVMRRYVMMSKSLRSAT